MSRRRAAIGVWVALAGCALPSLAWAQARPQPAPTAVGLRAFAVPFELERMAASRSFEVVLGGPAMSGFGGGADVLRLARQLFARVGFSRIAADGERVVIAGDEVFRFDPPIAVDISLSTIELGAGWQIGATRRATPPKLVPFVGAALVIARYRERTDFDETGEGEAESFTGLSLFGGVDVMMGRSWFIGAEAQYRTVPNALGEAGASAHFKETNLGGAAVRVTIGLRK